MPGCRLQGAVTTTRHDEGVRDPVGRRGDVRPLLGVRQHAVADDDVLDREQPARGQHVGVGGEEVPSGVELHCSTSGPEVLSAGREVTERNSPFPLCRSQ